VRTRIGTQLIVATGLANAVVIGAMSMLILRQHASQLVSERTNNAAQLSETIKRSTHFDMLENRRDNLYRQIRAIGELQEEGIRKVRLFNKEGRIMFSSESRETGSVLDKRGEACYACHAEGRPLEKLEMPARVRVFRARDGTRVLGIINPIPNEPGCSAAACHAHDGSQRVLGVLDVQVSMAGADLEVARSREVMVGLAALAIAASSLILWWLNRVLVLRPVRALVDGTHRVANGDLSTTIPVTAQHELGQLAAAFNSMTQRIAESQRQLTEADKLASVGRLAAGIAHEINNPLTGVLSYASVLRKRLAGDAETARDLDVIVRETIRCREIVKQLLDFGRPAPPVRAPTDLNEVVKRAVAVVMAQLSLNKVRLSLDFGQQLPLADADANQLQQVSVNLLLNAGDAAGTDGGEIRVATRLYQEGGAEPSLELSVEDTGRGIEPGDLHRIFEPFFTTKGSRGTGLGLAVTRSIVESHGGTIGVQSEPGRGSRFIVRLPVTGHAPARDGNGQPANGTRAASTAASTAA
jgi:two-component system NtrC family sensor kinase